MSKTADYDALLKKLRSRGYWRILVRPATYNETQFPRLRDLEHIIKTCTVSLRGWDFPHTSPHYKIEYLEDLHAIRQASRFGYHIDIWQMHQSGQFIYLRSQWPDWLDEDDIWHEPEVPPGWKHGQHLNVGDAIFLCAETLEFAARLAMTEADRGHGRLGDDGMVVEIGCIGIAGRELKIDETRYMGFVTPRQAKTSKWKEKRTLTRDQLLSDPREIALWYARELFAEFGWDAKKDVLRGMQGQLIPRR